MSWYLTLSMGGALICAVFAATSIASALARKGFPLPPEGRRIGCVDGLRGYLALAVVAHHFIIWIQVFRLGGDWSAPAVNLFNQLGAGAVALFFMTTGLVFYPTILKGFRATSWPSVFIGRVFRIIPLVLFSVVVITILIMVRTGETPGHDYPLAAAKWITAWSQPPLLGYPESGRLNAHVLWTLNLEWIFYLVVLPVCALLADLGRGRWPSWWLPVAVLFVSIASRAMQIPVIGSRYLPLFAIGMLAFEVQNRPWLAERLRHPAVGAAAVLALGVAACGFQYPYSFALPFFAFFFVCVACGNSVFGLLTKRGALVLGECSFGIYLLHGIALALVFTEGADVVALIATPWLPLLLLPVVLAVVLVTPLTFLVIEKPAMKFGRDLAQRWKARGSRAVAGPLNVEP
ncbi:MAG: acyltransferase family protein [Rhizobium sp.]|nr:acyltransferase family protein [Rhizobium sp.]